MRQQKGNREAGGCFQLVMTTDGVSAAVQFLCGASTDGRADLLQGWVREHFHHHNQEDQIALINAPDPQGWTPLHHASFHNHLSTVEVLVHHLGASDSLRCINTAGDTPMALAWTQEHLELCTFLANAPGGQRWDELQLQWEPPCTNHKDTTTTTPTANATTVANGNATRRDGNKNNTRRKVEVGLNAWHHACARGRVDLCEFLVAHGGGGSINTVTPRPPHLTPFAYACKYGHCEVAEYLFNHGAAECINLRHLPSKAFKTPLCLAAAGGFVGLVTWLLDHGARSGEPSSAIHNAFLGGHLDVCDLLVERGEGDSFKVTAYSVERACCDKDDDPSLCAWLLAQKGQRWVTRPCGGHEESPMMCACGCGNVAIADWLYHHGGEALTTRPDEYGNTPMVVACRQGHVKVCAWLRDHGVPVALTPSASASECGAGPGEVGTGAREVVGQRSRPRRRARRREFSPLHVACQFNQLRVVEWLLLNGARGDINAQDTGSAGNSALHVACAHAGLSMVELLYAHGAGASIALKNNFGRTPLHLASRASSSSASSGGVKGKHRRSERAIVEFLVTHGAGGCINLASAGGNTSLHEACLGGELEVCDFLRDHGGTHQPLTQSYDWHSCRFPLHVVEWVVRSYGVESLDEEACASAFSAYIGVCSSSGGSSDGGSRVLHGPSAMTWLPMSLLTHGGPSIVRELLPAHASDEVLEAAVRVGVGHRFVVNHSRLGEVLEVAVRRRRAAFVGAFLFGCRRSSGSTALWRIGSQHHFAGFRKEVGQYAGVVVEPEEFHRVLRVLRAHRRGDCC